MAHSRDSLLGIIELAGQPEKSYLGAKGLGGGGGGGDRSHRGGMAP